MKTSENLVTVEELFSAWRANRRNCAEPIPKQLWQKVKKLLPKYRSGLIAKRLRLRKLVKIS